MATTLNPYLSFRDTAREAMTHYHSVFGGDLSMSTYGDFHVSDDPAETDKIMHSQLDGANGLTLMGADTPNSMPYQTGTNVTVSLSGDDDVELRRYWDALSEGGTVTLPLEQAPWGDSFGQFTDRYGVQWMINIAGATS
jgi:PhnB protein